jgi:hypothetical protein
VALNSVYGTNLSVSTRKTLTVVSLDWMDIKTWRPLKNFETRNQIWKLVFASVKID